MNALSSSIYPNADRLLVILNYVLISASAGNITEQDLLQTLLRDYNTNVRPVREPSESVEVAIGVAMKQIVDLVSFPRPLNCHDFAVDLRLGYRTATLPRQSLYHCLCISYGPFKYNNTHIHHITSYIYGALVAYEAAWLFWWPGDRFTKKVSYLWKWANFSNFITFCKLAHLFGEFKVFH